MLCMHVSFGVYIPRTFIHQTDLNFIAWQGIEGKYGLISYMNLNGWYEEMKIVWFILKPQRIFWSHNGISKFLNVYGFV